MRIGLRFHLTTFFYIAIIVSIGALALSYLLISFWIKDGFSIMELATTMLFLSVFFFVLAIIVGRVMLLQYVQSCLTQNVEPLKWYYQFPLMAFCIVVAAASLDTVIYFAGGSAVSEALAKTLEDFGRSQGQNFEASDIEETGRLPFFVQNFYIVFFIVLGSFIAAFWVKFKTAPPKQGQAPVHQGVV